MRDFQTNRTAEAGQEQPGRALDWLNFFLADVRDGLGPYLAIYLLTVQKWDEASIGIVMTIGGIAAILAQTPAGAWIDNSRAKRSVVIGAAVVVTAASLLLPLVRILLPLPRCKASPARPAHCSSRQ